MVELALLPNAESSLEGITDTPDAFNKYWYPEFAGWHLSASVPNTPDAKA